MGHFRRKRVGFNPSWNCSNSRENEVGFEYLGNRYTLQVIHEDRVSELCDDDDWNQAAWEEILGQDLDFDFDADNLFGGDCDYDN